MFTVAITGHRKIDDEEFVCGQLQHAYGELEAVKVIQGMADGVDLLAAREAYSESIPYMCVRPWAGHKPGIGWEIMYEAALSHAESIVTLIDQEEFPGKLAYFDRNMWMVDNADALIAVWDGTVRSGTYHCLNYARKEGAPIWHIDPIKKTAGWLDAQ